MQTLFHENPYRKQIANGHSCMVRVHTKPEYQMMTPDTRHDTQASVQITTKTPFFYFDVITTFLRRYNDTMIQLTKRLQHSHSHSNSFKGGARLHQQSQPPCQSTTPASCSYSPLVSSMSLSCVPIDHSVCI